MRGGLVNDVLEREHNQEVMFMMHDGNPRHGQLEFLPTYMYVDTCVRIIYYTYIDTYLHPRIRFTQNHNQPGTFLNGLRTPKPDIYN